MPSGRRDRRQRSERKCSLEKRLEEECAWLPVDACWIGWIEVSRGSKANSSHLSTRRIDTELSSVHDTPTFFENKTFDDGSAGYSTARMVIASASSRLSRLNPRELMQVSKDGAAERRTPGTRNFVT